MARYFWRHVCLQLSFTDPIANSQRTCVMGICGRGIENGNLHPGFLVLWSSPGCTAFTNVQLTLTPGLAVSIR
ncbi:hypothetical protein B0T22DRAFT_15904 [Podospora appendiculata]|uniref:Uncharacterized protein n=1 Tax=Podospora appendiculata TaxID=314037 RepID=A0AAE0XGA6_9PEZI|nr:hypothetical protein B0T22DRAFT_15904 [Podospora appendiculata]